LGLVYDVPLHATGFCLGPSRALMIAALNSGVRPNYYGTLLERNPRLAKANEQYDYLTFTGDFDPQTITDRLPIIDDVMTSSAINFINKTNS
jgi:dienelactone hydrolase